MSFIVCYATKLYNVLLLIAYKCCMVYLIILFYLSFICVFIVCVSFYYELLFEINPDDGDDD